MNSSLDKEAVRHASRLEDVVAILTGAALQSNGGGEPLFRCRLHGDGSDDHASGRVNVTAQTWYCDVCQEGGDLFRFVERYRDCSFRDALTWLAERAGLTPAVTAKPTRTTRTSVGTWVYHDLDGQPVSRVHRYNHANGKKSFPQERADGNGGWIGGKGAMDNVERYLYDIHKLKGKSKTLWVEGEKCVDALRALDLPATTSPGGAGKVNATPIALGSYVAQLEHVGVQEVLVLSDNDVPGRKHGEAVARSCLDAGLTVKVVTLPDLPPKGDVVDYLAQHSRDELIALLKGAEVYVPLPDVGVPSTATPAEPAVRPAVFDPIDDGEDPDQEEDARTRKSNKSLATLLVALVQDRGAELWHTARTASGPSWMCSGESRSTSTRSLGIGE